MRVCGAALAARALTNLSIRRLTGIRAGRRAVDVEDAISISAPIERVWDIAGDYTKFPLFMTNVREVHRAAHGPTSHWEIAGPAGVLVRFDADETKRIEGRELAWETVEGELVSHTGAVRLDSEAAGTTRVLVQLTYNPIAGATGHAIATLLGADPARKLSEDLMRLKSALETGRAPADAARAGASP